MWAELLTGSLQKKAATYGVLSGKSEKPFLSCLVLEELQNAPNCGIPSRFLCFINLFFHVGVMLTLFLKVVLVLLSHCSNIWLSPFSNVFLLSFSSLWCHLSLVFCLCEMSLMLMPSKLLHSVHAISWKRTNIEQFQTDLDPHCFVFCFFSEPKPKACHPEEKTAENKDRIQLGAFLLQVWYSAVEERNAHFTVWHSAVMLDNIC